MRDRVRLMKDHIEPDYQHEVSDSKGYPREAQISEEVWLGFCTSVVNTVQAALFLSETNESKLQLK